MSENQYLTSIFRDQLRKRGWHGENADFEWFNGEPLLDGNPIFTPAPGDCVPISICEAASMTLAASLAVQFGAKATA